MTQFVKSDAGARVLVVEDECLINLSLCKCLEDEGFNVFSVRNGDEALRLLDREPFELVVTDVNMPGSIDGIQLVQQLRRESPDIELMVVSGHSTGRYLPPNVPLLRKPYVMAELIGIMHSLLDGREAKLHPLR